MAETASNNGSTNTNTSGQSSVAFDFVLKKDSDCIPDETMAEITRRTIGTVTSGEFGDVIFAKDPPNDTKKLWVEESNTGANIGTVKRYDSASGEWVDDHTVFPAIPEFPFPAFEEEDFTVASNDETIVFNHNFGDSEYYYDVVYTSEPTTSSRWWEVNRDENSLTIRIKDANGVGISIRAKANLSPA